MTSATSVIVIPPGLAPFAGDSFPTNPRETADWLNGQVHGHFECLRLTGGRDMWVNDSHAINGMAPNMFATLIAADSEAIMPGEVIHGPAVITGNRGPDTVALSFEQHAHSWEAIARHAITILSAVANF